MNDLEMHRRAALAGTARSMKLLDRIPSLFVSRGWKRDPDLESVIIAAVVCKRLGATATNFKRPDAAETLGGLWPEWDKTLDARQIVERLDLGELF